MTTSDRARAAADSVRDAFEVYRSGFRWFTAQAQLHFENADWQASLRDAADRLELYRSCADRAVADLRARLGAQVNDKQAWRALNAAYARHLPSRADVELAETFFNSITRRVFATVGVDPTIEFVHPAASEPLPSRFDAVLRVCPRRSTSAELVARLLGHHRFRNGWENLGRDAARVAAVLDAADASPVAALETARPAFFRNKGAYLVGRVHRVSGSAGPLVLALTNPHGRVVVDAALLTEDDASVVFSFTRSYFFVAAERPRELVGYLHSLMPRKPVSELYDALGHNKHGKTELYRALLAHVESSDDCFEIAPGQRGMVMVVFTLPSYDLVFKVIRDRFDFPKTSTRRDVMEKYQLVFKHDRAGRLVDAQEFEHLRFERSRFSQALVAELGAAAAATVAIDAERVVLHHLYTERRLRPLDVFLREAGPEERRRAVVDYGEALRDLASSNIFPGDLLLKNFGVTRHGRVVFYDYDELQLLTECSFRELPAARDEAEAGAEGPWFYVGPNDVFPEEFLPFLGLNRELRQVFLEHHAELLRPEFWIAMQQQHRAGQVPDIYPYPASSRLASRSAGAAAGA